MSIAKCAGVDHEVQTLQSQNAPNLHGDLLSVQLVGESKGEKTSEEKKDFSP